MLYNLNDDIRLMDNQYRWVRIQSPQNPKFWVRVQKWDAVHASILSNMPA